MTKYRRICILGNSGAGKSTLAAALGDVSGLPVVHLDRIFWKPGWIEAPEAEVRAAMTAAAENDAWIIDGNFKKTLPQRLEKADLVIYIITRFSACGECFGVCRGGRDVRIWRTAVRSDLTRNFMAMCYGLTGRRGRSCWR